VKREVCKITVNMHRTNSARTYDAGDYGPISIVYEDNHLLAVIKPAGILSQSDGTSKPDMLTILKQYLRQRYNKPGKIFLGLVHRLDCPVEGIMVFARTSKGASRISSQIRERTFIKKYYAVVAHQPYKTEGTLHNHILKEDGNTAVISDQGKSASLEYRLLAYKKENDLSLLDISLSTGRTHQIRLQLSHMGNPIVGDRKYNNNLTELTYRYEMNQEIALFSYFLSFNHPTLPCRLELVVDPPSCQPWIQFKEIFKQRSEEKTTPS
jgi:23S rRNA pseudouridine1911/1915/1917 synthase